MSFKITNAIFPGMKECPCRNKDIKSMCQEIDPCYIDSEFVGANNAAQIFNQYGEREGLKVVGNQKRQAQSAGGCRNQCRVLVVLCALEQQIKTRGG